MASTSGVTDNVQNGYLNLPLVGRRLSPGLYPGRRCSFLRHTRAAIYTKVVSATTLEGSEEVEV